MVGIVKKWNPKWLPFHKIYGLHCSGKHILYETILVINKRKEGDIFMQFIESFLIKMNRIGKYKSFETYRSMMVLHYSDCEGHMTPPSNICWIWYHTSLTTCKGTILQNLSISSLSFVTSVIHVLGSICTTHTDTTHWIKQPSVPHTKPILLHKACVPSSQSSQ